MLPLEITFDFSNITDFGISVALVGYLIVFSALVLLYFVFNTVPRFVNFKARRRLKKEGKCDNCEVMHVEGDVNAAISLALYLYLNEVHDEESDVITIEKKPKQYAPWSSKIYSTNSYFRIPIK